jgi:hypothetical protein
MSTSQLERWQRYVVIAHIALAVLYGAIIPPWEANDETGHYAYVNHLATTFTLPDTRASEDILVVQSHQPPLYYVVVSALTIWLDRSDQHPQLVNVFAFDGTNRRGTRLLLRDPGEDLPWRGTVLVLHAERVVSALISGLTIWLISLAARRLFASSPLAALLTTAIAAFNPQVLFMAAMVNNDVMVSLMGAALIYNITRIALTDDPQPSTTLRSLLRYAWIGVPLALALWSKNSALIFLPFTALALTLIAWRNRWQLSSLIMRGLVVLVVAVGVASPLYISNYLRYGTLLVDRAADVPIISGSASLIGEGLSVSLRDQWLPSIFVHAFRTFWGTFGWGTVLMPDAVHIAIAVVAVLGFVACVLFARRISQDERTGLLLLAMLGLCMMLLPAYRAIYYQSPTLLPGRYLMPALIAYTGIIGFGWSALFKRIPAATYALIGAFVALAIAVPFLIIRPAYAVSVTHTSDAANALLTFEDVAQVTNVSAQTVMAPDREGLRQYAHVQLTWRALRQVTENYAFGISILGRNAEVLGNLNINPARGNYPSTNWKPGDTFTDDYYVLLEKPCPSLPTMGRVSVGVYGYVPISGNVLGISVTRQLLARDSENRPIPPIVGSFRIEAPANPLPVFWQPARAMFNGIALRDVDLPHQVRAGSMVTVGITYETWRSSNPNGIGFVHIFDTTGKRIAQDDHAPVGGAYPTDMWMPGECVRETYSLDIPATTTGKLTVLTGFYAATDGARFQTGTHDNLVPLGEIEVIP